MMAGSMAAFRFLTQMKALLIVVPTALSFHGTLNSSTSCYRYGFPGRGRRGLDTSQHAENILGTYSLTLNGLKEEAAI